MFTVAISLGLRQGEALGLRWRDVDLQHGRLRVRYALQRLKISKADGGSQVQIHLIEPKTKKGRRAIDLPGLPTSALAAHQLHQTDEKELAGSRWRSLDVWIEGHVNPVDDFVFTTPIGTPLDGCNVTKRFQRLLAGAVISHHRFHDLRHTAATLVAVQGVHPKAIQSVLGWDQLSMVEHYTHCVDELRKDAATKMDDALKPVAVKVALKQIIPKLT